MKFINAKEAAEILNMSVVTLGRLLKKGDEKIPHTRFGGGHYKFTRESLEKYMELKINGFQIDVRRPKPKLQAVHL